MLQVEVSTPSPEPSFTPSLADLSRNASTISSSSSSDSTPSLLLTTPRPRPIRTFSSPRSKSPQSPTPRNSKPPSYLTKELGLSDAQLGPSLESRRATARARSKSRNPSVNGRLSAQDFEFGATLGEGSYSSVMRASYLATGQEYAVKILDKGHLKRNNKLQTALAEKNTLVRLGSGHPGIIRLHWAFHDEWSLYFVLDLARNGEMQSRISRLGSLSTACTQYYAAQIVDAVGYMHSRGVIHRDLKPENLLLDDAFRIKITDFGTGKLLEPGVERARTFVGTAQYVSPELLEANETSRSSDLWALGCIIYQMIAGRFAFQGLSEYLTWQKIKQLDYTFPEGFDEQAKDLVQKLLVYDPAQRLGAGPPGSPYDMQTLRSHPFFSAIVWERLWSDPAPPLEPGLVKKEHPLAGQDPNWEDVGAAWDDLVEGEGPDMDEISWASDAEGPAYLLVKQGGCDGYGGAGFLHSSEVGPMGEIPRYTNGFRGDALASQMEEDTETIMGEGDAEPASMVAHAIDVPNPSADSTSTGTGSPASSSDGSPVEKLGATLEEMQIDRGRNRVQTPVQGNGPSSDTDWSSVLLPSEIILYSSPVEVRSIRRRASRLLPISVSPMKPKTRQLVLTTHRLLCLKQVTKGRGSVAVKSELVLRASEKVKEKDAKAVVSSAELKGEREFVILNSSKSQTYGAENPKAASIWIQKITEAVKDHGQPQQLPPPPKSRT